MQRKKEYALCMQDLKLVSECRQISSRFHRATAWLEDQNQDYQRDEGIATVVIGGTEGTMTDSLTFGEIQCIARQHEWFLRQERSLERRLKLLRAEIESELTALNSAQNQ